jgi:hypothetical protein
MSGIVYKHNVRPVTIDQLLHVAHKVFNTTRRDIYHGGRVGCLPYVRRIICVTLRGMGLSYDEAGRWMNMTRHNVMAHCKKHKEQIEQDENYAASFKEYTEQVKGIK